MIRTLMATTALAALLATGAWAQEGAIKADGTPATSTGTKAAKGPAGYFSASPEQVLATSVLGKTVYTGADEQGEAIGDVNDVVINADGGAEALVVGVGGFLGIGEKDVAVSFDRVSWSDRDGAAYHRDFGDQGRAAGRSGIPALGHRGWCCGNGTGSR